MLFSVWIITHHLFLPTTALPIEHSVQNIGLQLLSYTSYGYVFPFEVVSILLLAALVGSIVIAMKIKKQ
jgi:NADH-quinone oxidoreductase subunit J